MTMDCKMTSNRMFGLDFELGETAEMICSSVDSFAQARSVQGVNCGSVI